MPQFYRFSHPMSNRYPAMIELFTRKLDAIQLPDDAVLTPLPMDEDISSLSAILLDDDYYEFDEKNYCLLGRRKKRQYRLGAPITIKVAQANLERKQLDFQLAE